MSGYLAAVATPIGNLGDFSKRAAETLEAADIIACEDTRMTRKLMALLGQNPKADLVPYHDHNGATMRPKLLDAIANGKKVALVSDAGTPLISDPGYKLVAECHDRNLRVFSVPGASAPLSALAAAGLPSDRFLFGGFVPSAANAANASLREFSALPVTTIWFETPKRLIRTLELMLDIFGPRLAVVARELTKLHEEIERAPLDDMVKTFKRRDSIKGEIVILVEGASTVPQAFDDIELALMLREELGDATLRDAVQTVTDITGLPRKRVYKIALDITNTDSNS
jgi:16S rRNA (cytidine1402-2'-O)-methyltransferase